MRWGVLLVVSLVLIAGVIFLVTRDSKENDIVMNNSVEEASPKIIETSQEKLETVTSKVYSNGTVKNILRVIDYREEMALESIVLARKGEHLNLNESVHDAFGDKVFERNLNNYLKRGSFNNINQKHIAYEQKIEFLDKLYLTVFRDREYLGNNEQYTGVIIPMNTALMTYSLSFIDEVSWDDLVGSFVRFLGRSYYVISSSGDKGVIEMYEKPVAFEIKEGETVRVNHPNFLIKEIAIDSIDKDRVKIDVNGKISEYYSLGGSYDLGDFKLYVGEISYNDKGPSIVGLVVSPTVLKLTTDGVFHDGIKVDGLRCDFFPSFEKNIDNIMISWDINEKTFFTKTSSLSLPYFFNLNMTVGKSEYDDKSKEFADITLSDSTYNIV